MEKNRYKNSQIILNTLFFPKYSKYFDKVNPILNKIEQNKTKSLFTYLPNLNHISNMTRQQKKVSANNYWKKIIEEKDDYKIIIFNLTIFFNKKKLLLFLLSSSSSLSPL